jgi:pimeloyl-ACP methyl ester carboxylesterase
MKRIRFAATLVFALASMAGAFASEPAARKAPQPDAKPVIVLVHGAFADGSCWSKVIPLLEKEGYSVTAVQNPLTSFADDVATTKRVVDAQKGPVVLVGHSYGGAVITATSAATPNVKALVYVAAFAPDAEERIGPLLEKYPSAIGTALVPDAAGFITIDRAKFQEVFAKDVTTVEARVMAATQKPFKGEIFGHKFAAPGWKNIPSWYLVATEDQAINPDLQRLFARRMNAKTAESKSSHVPFISKPNRVAELILEAAKSPAK